VLLSAYGLCVLSQQDRDAFGDQVPAAQPGVIERHLVVEVQQSALINGAHQDLQQFLL
jgi:hypothetical protein